MKSTRHDIIRIGAYQIDPSQNRIHRKGMEDLRIEPKAMELLIYLWERRDQVVSRQHILADVWEDRAVVQQVVSKCIHQLRNAIESDPKQPQRIVTVPKRGYCLVSETPEESSRLLKRGSMARYRWPFVATAFFLVTVALVWSPWNALTARNQAAEPFLFVAPVAYFQDDQLEPKNHGNVSQQLKHALIRKTCLTIMDDPQVATHSNISKNLFS